MSYSIVFSSKTGNTELIAKRISKLMGEDGCVYFGAPEQAPANAADADIVFVGSWTDKGTSTSEIAEFVHGLSHKRVFIFGTCGFGESAEYFNGVLARMRGDLTASCDLVGSFMCQGKMPETVLGRYKKMLADADPDSPEAKRAEMFIRNFEVARTHPDNDDLRALEASLRDAGLI